MSTPIPRSCKLQGLELYAPRRARRSTPTIEETIEDRWRGKLERIAAAQASITALDSENRENAIAASPRAAPSRQTPQTARSGSPIDADNWPRVAADSPRFGWRTEAHDRAPRRLDIEPEIAPEPPIDPQRTIALPLLVRVPVVGCVAAVAALGLTTVFTFPSAGHAHRDAGSDLAAVRTIADGANALPRQSRSMSESRKSQERIIELGSAEEKSLPVARVAP